ncbi:MAG: DoxX family protein [Fimbriimonadales bacterium]
MSLRGFLLGPGGAGSPSADFGLLLLRLVAGLSLAFGHGLGKLPPSSEFMSGVAKMGFPVPEAFGWAAALSEFLGGILVALGLLTRPAALVAFTTMAVALFVRHGSDPFTTKEKALLYAAVFLAILFTGAGRYSFDSAIGGKGK